MAKDYNICELCSGTGQVKSYKRYGQAICYSCGGSGRHTIDKKSFEKKEKYTKQKFSNKKIKRIFAGKRS